MPDDQRDILIQLALETRQRGWWHPHRAAVSAPQGTYLGLEHAANELRIYTVGRVHGLLQTEDYARAALKAARPGNIEADTERSVALLMERQRQVAATTATLEVVLGEAALRTQTGGRAVLRGQIRHLGELS